MEKILMKDLSMPQQRILKYLYHKWEWMPEWISPTHIGQEVGGFPRHSAWASPKCLALVKKGLVLRGPGGKYMISKKGVAFYREWVRSLTDKREDKGEGS